MLYHSFDLSMTRRTDTLCSIKQAGSSDWVPSMTIAIVTAHDGNAPACRRALTSRSDSSLSRWTVSTSAARTPRMSALQLWTQSLWERSAADIFFTMDGHLIRDTTLSQPRLSNTVAAAHFHRRSTRHTKISRAGLQDSSSIDRLR